MSRQHRTQSTDANWFAVIRISDYAHIYLGPTAAGAEAASIPGTHLAAGPTRGEAMRRSAIDVAYIRRGLNPVYGTGNGMTTAG